MTRHLSPRFIVLLFFVSTGAAGVPQIVVIAWAVDAPVERAPQPVRRPRRPSRRGGRRREDAPSLRPSDPAEARPADAPCRLLGETYAPEVCAAVAPVRELSYRVVDAAGRIGATL